MKGVKISLESGNGALLRQVMVHIKLYLVYLDAIFCFRNAVDATPAGSQQKRVKRPRK